MSEETTTNPAFILGAPKYRCPMHGIVENVITSAIEGHKGHWCQRCWLESLDAVGVSRCEPVQ